MRLEQLHENDKELENIVQRITDEVHEGPTYAWVNKKALETFNQSLGRTETLETLKDDDREYQVFVDYQCSYLRDIVIMVLNRF